MMSSKTVTPVRVTPANNSPDPGTQIREYVSRQRVHDEDQHTSYPQASSVRLSHQNFRSREFRLRISFLPHSKDPSNDESWKDNGQKYVVIQERTDVPVKKSTRCTKSATGWAVNSKEQLARTWRINTCCWVNNIEKRTSCQGGSRRDHQWILDLHHFLFSSEIISGIVILKRAPDSRPFSALATPPNPRARRSTRARPSPVPTGRTPRYRS